MENEQKQPEKIPSKNKWYAGYIVAGIIFTFANQAKMNKTPGGEILVTVVAIVAGIFFHKFKTITKIKNSVLAFIILTMVSAVIIGFLTPFANLILIETGVDNPDTNGWTETSKSTFIKESTDSCGAGQEKFCTCVAEYLIKKYTFDEVQKMAESIRKNNPDTQGVKNATDYCQSTFK